MRHCQLKIDEKVPEIVSKLGLRVNFKLNQGDWYLSGISSLLF